MVQQGRREANSCLFQVASWFLFQLSTGADHPVELALSLHHSKSGGVAID